MNLSSALVSSALVSSPPLSPLPEYAQVIKMLGNGRLEAMCFDGTKRLCHIRGKLRKKVGESTFSLPPPTSTQGKPPDAVLSRRVLNGLGGSQCSACCCVTRR